MLLRNTQNNVHAKLEIDMAWRLDRISKSKYSLEKIKAEM